jgi:threonine/homoserine/homoserine lactone efflux protein
MAITQDIPTTLVVSRKQLAIQGFVTAVANPKGWAFFIALLPPFIDYQQPILLLYVSNISAQGTPWHLLCITHR